MRALGLAVLAAGLIGCGPPPPASMRTASPPASAQSPSVSAREGLTKAEARKANVEKFEQQLRRDFPAIQRIDRDDFDAEISLLIASSQVGEGPVRLTGWVVNDRSNAPFAEPLESDDYALVRSDARALVSLKHQGQCVAVVRVGPAGELTTAMIPRFCSAARVAETVCGGEALCASGLGVLGEENLALDPSECSLLRSELVFRSPTIVADFRKRERQRLAQPLPDEGSCARPTQASLDALVPRIKPLMQRKFAASMRDFYATKATEGMPQIRVMASCPDAKGNYLVRSVVDLRNPMVVVVFWRVSGQTLSELGSYASDGPPSEIGDFDGDGLSEFVVDYFDTRRQRPTCRLHSLSMKPRDVPTDFCHYSRWTAALSDRVVAVLDEKIFGFDQRGAAVELSGSGSHEALQRKLNEMAALPGVTKAFVNSLAQAPKDWGRRESACQNPVRAAWVKEAVPHFLGFGYTRDEASHTALVLAGLEGCPPAGLF